jgi:hypothetical protein
VQPVKTIRQAVNRGFIIDVESGWVP